MHKCDRAHLFVVNSNCNRRTIWFWAWFNLNRCSISKASTHYFELAIILKYYLINNKLKKTKMKKNCFISTIPNQNHFWLTQYWRMNPDEWLSFWTTLCAFLIGRTEFDGGTHTPETLNYGHTYKWQLVAQCACSLCVLWTSELRQDSCYQWNNMPNYRWVALAPTRINNAMTFFIFQILFGFYFLVILFV